MSVHKIARSDL